MNRGVTTQMIKALLFGTVLAVCTRAYGQEPRRDEPKGGTGITETDGQYGLYRLSLPVSPERYVAVSLSGGYGFIEAISPTTGTHNRMQGRFTVSGAPIKQVGLGLSIDGFRDSHPPDADGEDTTGVGMPSLYLHGGGQIGRVFQLGAEVRWLVPGSDAPSFQFDAGTVEMSVAAAVAPTGKRWSMPILVGYRLDNTDRAMPDPSTLRSGDRISLNASAFDAVLLGLGAATRLGRFSLYGELLAQILVGSGAPTSASPVQLAVGGRFHALRLLTLSLSTNTLLTGRPSIAEEAPFAPTPPRFSIAAGISYAFGFDSPDSTQKNEQQPSAAPPPPTQEKSPPAETARISGKVQDEEGNPVGGVAVTIEADGRSFTTATDGAGAYAVDGLPIGPGVLTIQTKGFTPVVSDIILGKSDTPREPDTLVHIPLETRTQLKGLVRSIEGKPLSVKVIVQPGGHILETDAEGYFLKDLKPGHYKVKISAPGFRTQIKKVQIESGSVTILNVDMSPVK